MRFVILGAALFSAIGAAATIPAKAAPNPALCMALAENYNQCQRQAQRQNYQGGWGGGYGYDRGYGGGWGGHDDDGWGGHRHGGGWGGDGYGYDRGYGGGWGGRGYGGGRPQAKQAECARWLVALQQNQCAPGQ
jgi:hypothetical protein